MHMVLILNLIRTALLPIYKDIVRILDWGGKFEKLKALKKRVKCKIMLIAWHAERWWN